MFESYSICSPQSFSLHNASMLIIYTWLIHVKKSFRKGFCVFGTVKPNIDGHSWHIPHAMWVLFTSNWHSGAASSMRKYLFITISPLYMRVHPKGRKTYILMWVFEVRFGFWVWLQHMTISPLHMFHVVPPVQVQVYGSWHLKVQVILY